MLAAAPPTPLTPHINALVSSRGCAGFTATAATLIMLSAMIYLGDAWHPYSHEFFLAQCHVVELALQSSRVPLRERCDASKFSCGYNVLTPGWTVDVTLLSQVSKHHHGEAAVLHRSGDLTFHTPPPWRSLALPALHPLGSKPTVAGRIVHGACAGQIWHSLSDARDACLARGHEWMQQLEVGKTYACHAEHVGAARVYFDVKRPRSIYVLTLLSCALALAAGHVALSCCARLGVSPLARRPSADDDDDDAERGKRPRVSDDGRSSYDRLRTPSAASALRDQRSTEGHYLDDNASLDGSAESAAYSRSSAPERAPRGRGFALTSAVGLDGYGHGATGRNGSVGGVRSPRAAIAAVSTGLRRVSSHSWLSKLGVSAGGSGNNSWHGGRVWTTASGRESLDRSGHGFGEGGSLREGETTAGAAGAAPAPASPPALRSGGRASPPPAAAARQGGRASPPTLAPAAAYDSASPFLSRRADLVGVGAVLDEARRGAANADNLVLAWSEGGGGGFGLRGMSASPTNEHDDDGTSRPIFGKSNELFPSSGRDLF